MGMGVWLISERKEEEEEGEKKEREKKKEKKRKRKKARSKEEKKQKKKNFSPASTPLVAATGAAAGLSAARGPSTIAPAAETLASRAAQSAWRESGSGEPTSTTPDLARVRATLRRRGSARKPIPAAAPEDWGGEGPPGPPPVPPPRHKPFGGAVASPPVLTAENTMNSFSRPWNPSTEATSTAS
jgi:hypothetical protein